MTKPKSNKGRKVVFDPEPDEVEKVIRLTGGHKGNIARHFGQSRYILERYYDKFPELRKVISEEQEIVLDDIKQTAFDLALEGNTKMIEFILRTRGGWNEKRLLEVSGNVNHLFQERDPAADANYFLRVVEVMRERVDPSLFPELPATVPQIEIVDGEVSEVD